MRRSVLGLALLGAAAAAAGCGAGGDGDDGSHVDGGGPSDAGGCQVYVNLPQVPPVVGSEVVLESSVPGGSGTYVYTWSIVRRATPQVPAEVITPMLPGDGRDARFTPTVAGIHDVRLTVNDPSCQAFNGQLSVTTAGAASRVIRLRFVPPSAGVPPQQKTLTIVGGSDNPANIVSLDPGQLYPLAVRGPLSVPLPGYLRFISRATPDAIVEGYSDAAGAASVRLVPGLYDVLVVPTSTEVAPRLVTAFEPLSGAITLDAGTELTGFVRDGAGAPIEGARVTVTSGATPSTVGTTAADGRYRLRWRDDPLATEIITIAPPATGALPRIDASVSLAGRAAVDVRFATVATRDLGGLIVRSGGTAAASTDVVVSATTAAAATVLDGSTTISTGPGVWRRTGRTTAAGALPAMRVPLVSGEIFAARGNGVAATAPLGTAPSFDLSATTVTGRVLRSVDPPTARPGATVRAVLTGTSTFPGAPNPSTVADSDGHFSLAVASGASYDLVIGDPTLVDADRHVATQPTGASVDLGSLRLPAGILVIGEVRTTGVSVGLRGVGVAALCHLDCTGIERTRPLGSTVTNEFGAFAVAVPDPGVTP